MARLLVSVRSAQEAREALGGGADVIDVKEPDNGPLGRSSFSTWREVAHLVGDAAPTSVAMGELAEWSDDVRPPAGMFEGLAFCKLGLSRAAGNWEDAWRRLDSRLERGACRWIAVVYTDHERARSPRPSRILDPPVEVAGVLFDTWDKSRPSVWTSELLESVDEVRRRGWLLAVAGGLNCDSIGSLDAISPDLVAVRGAACARGDRKAPIEASRVARLAEIAHAIGHQPTSNRTPWASGKSLP